MTLIMVGVGFTLGIVGPLLAQQDDTIYQPGNGVSAPKLVTDVKPQYSADAVRRGVTWSGASAMRRRSRRCPNQPRGRPAVG